MATDKAIMLIHRDDSIMYMHHYAGIEGCGKLQYFEKIWGEREGHRFYFRLFYSQIHFFSSRKLTNNY